MRVSTQFESLTGLDKIKIWWAEKANYPSTQKAILECEYFSTKDEIEFTFNGIDEWLHLSQTNTTQTEFKSKEDINSLLPLLKIDNYFFDELQLFNIYSNINNYLQWHTFFGKKQNLYPTLNSFFIELNGLKECHLAIFSAINEKAELRTNASVNYGKINHSIIKLETEVREIVYSLFKKVRAEDWAGDTEITLRDDRLVLPIIAEHKKKVPGFVKDISASGKILYIEPIQTLEINNRLRELYSERKREREKILIDTTSQLQPYKESLLSIANILQQIDFISSRAKLADQLKAQRPKIAAALSIVLKNAVHPILQKTLQQQGKNSIPISIQLNQKNKMLVISGPNAGGKSIAMKTILLLQSMAQLGLFITALPESEMGLFDFMAIECGDGQNIENGLSTFSAHLQHLFSILNNVGNHSLIAIDEMGMGTDPRFGAPLAIAYMQEILKKNSLCIITTHFSDVKEWAYEHKENGVINAGMAYDLKELKPLYEIQIGKPGGSFALEIMKNTGFSSQFLETVKQIAGREGTRAETILSDLEEELQQAKITNLLLQEKEKHIDTLIAEYTCLKEQIEKKKKEILDTAKYKATQLLNKTNQEIELTIRTIKENKAEKNITKKVRENLQKVQNEVKISTQPEKTTTQEPQTRDWQPLLGMRVKHVYNEAEGEIIEIKKEQFLVKFGLVKMWMNKNEIAPISKSKIEKNQNKTVGFNWIQRQSQYQSSKDIRGLLAEEAKIEVEKWIEEGYALGVSRLKVVHGKGDGKLRNMLKELFKKHNIVKNYTFEHANLGGDGVMWLDLL